MNELPPFLSQALGYAQPAIDLALSWLTSAAAWSQFGLLVAAFLAARFACDRSTPWLTKLLTPEEDAVSVFAKARRFVLMFLPLLLPLLAYVFTAIGEEITRAIFDSGAVIAFGKRVFLLLAARILVQEIIQDPFLKLLGRYVVIPVAALNALGLLAVATERLETLVIPLGNLSFSILFLVRFLVVASVIFWLGRWSNDQSAHYIQKQQDMRPATRELAAKAAEFTIFGAAFLIFLNVMGLDLRLLTVLGGAIGVGLGFGLQKIASNYISGIILLLEGQATVGDYVELDGGEAGTIHKMTARAVILETYDGRWILVPNEDFITTRVVNFSDQGSANRYEAAFSVGYDTDINTIPKIIETAVAKHPEVLAQPYPPDCELRSFGESGIDFAVEFWVNGVDDGSKKYTSDILFLIWNALRDAKIEIPYPQQVVHIKGDVHTRAR